METLDQATWPAFLETFFGIVELDIEIPQDKYEYFSEMPPIFKNIVYSEEEGGEYMKNVILGKREKCTMDRKLIASLKATRIAMLSTQLNWLLEKGAIVTKVYGVVPAERGRPFKDFCDWVTEERRKGDSDACHAIIAEAAKTVGNSAYGRTGMNKINLRKSDFALRNNSIEQKITISFAMQKSTMEYMRYPVEQGLLSKIYRFKWPSAY